jgi:hypothetical protein
MGTHEIPRSCPPPSRPERVPFLSMVSETFSLPTVCGHVPEPDPDLVSDVRFEMHEDDWRQIEFVDAALTGLVEQQRRLVREVVDHHARRDSTGRPVSFGRRHVRAEPADPLPKGITVRRLVEAMDADTAYTGVGFHGRPWLVPRSFAFGSGPLVCYGLLEGGLVKVLGLNRMPGAGTGLGFEDTLLVDWLSLS